MNQPTLSVLLPNFNNAPYLRECLNSLYNQTFQDFVIYFVDDCSTDDSIEIALSYPQNKMIILRKDKNSGIVDTLNLGLDQITSKYFIRMDGDDRSHLERFEKMVGYMEPHVM
ncbi:MAG: glycosyltransferase family 2 protein [Crocinitomicaceae bacterium]|nr:glycosyltransferase family 2 protein [Crocinitomicaceae bacterium]